MSPTSISGGGKLLTGGELISPASCDAKLVPAGKRQEEALPMAKLEQWRYKNERQTRRNLQPCCKNNRKEEVSVYHCFNCSAKYCVTNEYLLYFSHLKERVVH